MIGLVAVVYFVRYNLSNSPQPILLPVPDVLATRNWAGYEVATSFVVPESSVQAVSASWVVPSVKDIRTDAYSSVWVGIGGQFELSNSGWDRTRFYEWLLPTQNHTHSSPNSEVTQKPGFLVTNIPIVNSYTIVVVIAIVEVFCSFIAESSSKRIRS